MNDMRSAQERAQQGAQNGDQSGAQADARRAAERLAEAQRMMNGLRQQQSGSQLDDLSQRADQLAGQQHDFENRLRQTFGADPTGRNGQPGGAQQRPSAAQQRALAEEKDKMAQELDKLERDMQRAARELAGAQPSSAARVRDGLSDIQQNETKMRMQYSARFIREGSGQLMVPREAPITQALDELSKDLQAARSAINPNAQQANQQGLEGSIARLERLREQMQQMAQRGQQNGRQGSQQGNQQGNQQGGQQQGNQQGQQGQGGQQSGGQQGGGQQGGQTGGQMGGNGTAGGRGSMLGGANRAGGSFGAFGRYQPEGVYDTNNIQYADPGTIARDAQLQLNELREQFKDNPDLAGEINDISRDLSRLSVGQTASNELDARISRQILPKLETLEVLLRREAAESETGQVRSGSADRVAPGFTDAVAEYFRKLSKGR